MSEALDGDASSPLRALLPFRVNGSLQGEELQNLDAAMAQDAALVDEARALAQLRRDIHDLPAPVSPGEFGLARLLQDLDRSADLSHHPRQTGPRPAILTAIWTAIWTAFLPTFLTAIRPVRQPMWMVAFAAGIIGLGLGHALWSDWQGNVTPGYQQASARSGMATLSVTFEPTVSQAALTQLLLAHDLSIVDGPSALGVYRLALPDAVDRQPVIEALQQAETLVESVSFSE